MTGCEKSTSAARDGSIPTITRSHSAVLTHSTALGGVGRPTSCAATPRRLASPRAISMDTIPAANARSSPVAGSSAYCGGNSATRILPACTRSATLESPSDGVAESARTDRIAATAVAALRLLIACCLSDDPRGDQGRERWRTATCESNRKPSLASTISPHAREQPWPRVRRRPDPFADRRTPPKPSAQSGTCRPGGARLRQG
jgi:hypothetical protein